ncbi:MerR family transcriptional regulator [Paenibacillus radicis (ex Gao et al. 2016)]|uniref:MerR family transcriptional regulator n=1 Tax=Paenibacillus radicis (ex Gao et al. 2016) TaxID=1737354 RepID=A0A917GNP1_9BACL|nr:MerR family transcriptional regulator [Paenibacillus radicis (ex Gao et al. 2016)]GGG52069.1 MerR family transcriptional regulator [Paenibacillus radicis (ex Gao et al. 2016)]
MYTVKEVAQMLDLTEHAVRFYTDKGLIPTLLRDQNNARLFNEESINWLTGVKILKQCGMSIEDIKAYVDLCLEGDSTIRERYEIIVRQKERALLQLQEAKNRADYMEAKTKYYLNIMDGVIADGSNPAKWNLKKAAHEIENWTSVKTVDAK